jgi:GNAT superfamily N-acetyltransferase
MIRPAVPGDTPTLISLAEETAMFRPVEIKALREVLDDYYKENQAEGHRAIAYEIDGQTLGFAYYAPAEMADRTWQLYWIVVQKARQSRGIGKELIRFVEDDIRRQRGRLLFIETSSMPHYEPTRRFYLKLGYEQHALLRDFYTDGDSMVVFRKSLQ